MKMESTVLYSGILPRGNFFVDRKFQGGELLRLFYAAIILKQRHIDRTVNYEEKISTNQQKLSLLKTLYA